MCDPDVAQNLNVKVFDLTSRTNETRHIEWPKTCNCKWKLDEGICKIINNVGIMINAGVNAKN